MKKILVLNSGSSSLKFQLFDLPGLETAATGLVENIGRTGTARIVYPEKGRDGKSMERSVSAGDHRDAIRIMAELLRESQELNDISELSAIGHRVVHGGEYFRKPVVIDEKVISAIKDLIPLAPLHNPANLMGIQVALEHAPDIPQVAVFDTAFHQSIPEHAYLYALPCKIYEDYRVRRYGFHGTSHGFVAGKAADFLGHLLEDLNIITLHLGNGASAAAIHRGACLDTSIGFTPLEGLIMGTEAETSILQSCSIS